MTHNQASEPSLFALLGHELRTPLNAIIGYADAMRTQAFGPLNTPYDQQAAIIHVAALHLLALIEDMTDQALQEGGPWITRAEAFDPAEVARTIVDLLAPGSAAAIRIEIGPGVGRCVGDRRAVAQILLNLIDNARKHTARDGEIVVRLVKAGSDLRVTVSDSGPGPPSETPPPKSTGLGLRVVRTLCARLGGLITCADDAPGGFTAQVTLPLSSES